jgi:hypothetical protein
MSSIIQVFNSIPVADYPRLDDGCFSSRRISRCFRPRSYAPFYCTVRSCSHRSTSLGFLCLSSTFVRENTFISKSIYHDARTKSSVKHTIHLSQSDNVRRFCSLSPRFLPIRLIPFALHPARCPNNDSACCSKHLPGPLSIPPNLNSSNDLQGESFAR